MAIRRKLSPNEKEQVRDQVRTREMAVHPGANITVNVADETDITGKAIVTIIRIVTEKLPPKRET